MSGTKPLIFVRPLSESLKKLHEVISETAAEEGIEIYEVDEMNEANQLLPSIGQSLSIFSNPKKCAAVLQTNKRAIHKLNSKVILLSSSSIPRKTLDKFSKIGLTECIVEPVPPKTLLYKVKLLLRSIATTSEEDEQNSERKFSQSEDENNDSKNEKQRLEKGIIAEDENVIDMNLKGKIGTQLDLTSEDEESENKKNYKEDDISTNWEGEVGSTNLKFDEDSEEAKKKNKYSEENIDTYLRNKKSNDTKLEFNDDLKSDKDKKNKNVDDFDDDLYAEKSKSNSLNLQAEEAKKKNKENQEKEDDKYYKGKVSEGLSLDFEEDENKTSNKQNENSDSNEDTESKDKDSFDLDLQSLEAEAAALASKEEESLSFEKNKKQSLELSPEEELKRNKSKEELVLEKEKKQREQQNQDENKEKKRRELEENGTLDLSSDEENSEDDDKKNENEIDKYMKGNVAKTITLTEEEEIDARNANALEEDDDSKKSKDELDFGLDLDAEEDRDKKNKEILNNLIEANKKEKEQNKNKNNENDEYDKTSEDSINLEFDKDSSLTNDEEESNDEEDDLLKATSKSLDLALDTDGENDGSNKNDKDGEEDRYNRLKTSGELDLEVEKEAKKFHAHTEHIQTNLDSRKSLNHQEYDWDINKNKEKSEKYDQEKKAKSQIEISFKQKVDLGEQTIDYRKLHDANEAITITRSGNKQKKTGPTYTSDDSQKDFLKGIYDDEYNNAAEDVLNEQDSKKAKKVKEEIFFPQSNGIEVAIKVLSKYNDKKLNKEDLYQYVYTSLKELFGATTFFFNFEPGKNDFIQNFNISENSPLYDETIVSNFKTTYEINISTWKDLNLPTWENEKFNTKENMFFYPLYEGANKLGFCVCLFENSFDGKKAKAVEVVLESLRGIFLDDFHKQGNAEKYNVNLNKEVAKEEKTGILSFIGKLFGRAS